MFAMDFRCDFSSTIEPGRREPERAELPSIWDMPPDLTVLGQGAGGKDGRFELQGQGVLMVRRPPALRGVREAYGLHVAGESMSPWREDRGLVYVHPGLSVRLQDYVVVQLHAPDGENPPAYIKRLVKRTGTEIHLLQFNPRKIIRIPIKRVKSIHRIVDWPELLGL